MDDPMRDYVRTQVPDESGLAPEWATRQRGEMQIRDLFVLPHHRRLGVGRALLDFLRVASVAAGALRLALQTENDDDPALRLYAESGYTSVEGYRSLTLPLSAGSPAS